MPEKSPSQVVAELVIPEKIVVLIDGKEWTIVASPRVLMLAEKVTGLNLLLGVGEMVVKPTMEFVCAMLYACMKAEGSSYTLDQVSAFVNFTNLPTISKAVQLALMREMKVLIEAAEQEANPTQAAS